MGTDKSPLCYLNFSLFSALLLILLATLTSGAGLQTLKFHGFSFREITVQQIQVGFKRNQFTSRGLVEFYLKEISRINPVLKGVLEVNPDARSQADKADHERYTKAPISLSPLHGVPILIKDNIATKDKMNTTAGSYALLGSVVPRDAGVVTKLRKAGAIILGKASLSEWSNFRSDNAPSGWSGRGGQGKNPYTGGYPCGSSSGSAISVAANMGAVSIGTETDGSILCPSNNNLVVGFKPTVGLTSRAGVIPISPRQDSVGPICRTVSDAVYVLDVIAGIDYNDKATIETSRHIPKGGYAQFLKPDGLRGKRLGIVRNPFYLGMGNDTTAIVEKHLNTLRNRGAVLLDNLEIPNLAAYDISGSAETVALLAEFRISLNEYLKELVASPVRSLADAIAFNKKNPKLEKLEYGQELFIKAEATKGIGKAEKKALSYMERLNREGFVKLMIQNKLDALVTPTYSVCSILAIGGFPGVIVPAGFDSDGQPFGLVFGGLKGSEPKLIEIAYGFEQATKIRKPPKL
ncbi:probable amidase At4g34880 [Carya illinoinensis]|uniref:probable amidase At4g34880 n=1 Tax=Carya illinoinensis TaxID=32201 RepID=UPI001C71B6BE|nr:probable amidase At4g34880 [Carya illinoinensis]